MNQILKPQFCDRCGEKIPKNQEPFLEQFGDEYGTETRQYCKECHDRFCIAEQNIQLEVAHEEQYLRECNQFEN